MKPTFQSREILAMSREVVTEESCYGPHGSGVLAGCHIRAVGVVTRTTPDLKYAGNPLQAPQIVSAKQDYNSHTPREVRP